VLPNFAEHDEDTKNHPIETPILPHEYVRRYLDRQDECLGHIYIYDEDTLRRVLTRAGFRQADIRATSEANKSRSATCSITWSDSTTSNMPLGNG
jgi:hypothetical protein